MTHGELAWLFLVIWMAVPPPKTAINVFGQGFLILACLFNFVLMVIDHMHPAINLG